MVQSISLMPKSHSPEGWKAMCRGPEPGAVSTTLCSAPARRERVSGGAAAGVLTVHKGVAGRGVAGAPDRVPVAELIL